jgi:hypothetical protein
MNRCPKLPRDYLDVAQTVFDAKSKALMAIIDNAPASLADIDVLARDVRHTMYAKDVRPNKKVGVLMLYSPRAP